LERVCEPFISHIFMIKSIVFIFWKNLCKLIHPRFSLMMVIKSVVLLVWLYGIQSSSWLVILFSLSLCFCWWTMTFKMTSLTECLFGNSAQELRVHTYPFVKLIRIWLSKKLVTICFYFFLCTINHASLHHPPTRRCSFMYRMAILRTLFPKLFFHVLHYDHISEGSLFQQSWKRAAEFSKTKLC
jgi:hypothetical protein